MKANIFPFLDFGNGQNELFFKEVYQNSLLKANAIISWLSFGKVQMTNCEGVVLFNYKVAVNSSAKNESISQKNFKCI